jgi:branched-chain amino acid transport system ATP-binding protein
LVGIIGPNGAGKSSVFNLIAGTLRPDSGSVVLQGRDVTVLNAAQRVKAGIFRAFQIPQAFPHMSVYENILAAASFSANRNLREAEERAFAAMERTALSPRANALAGSVPLLDRKRLELAKGLASDPKVLMLDEIGGGLTEREVATLVDLIQEIKPDFGILWIEHIAHALKQVADRIILLNFGEVLLDDGPDTVLAHPKTQTIYMGMPEDV